MRKLITLLVAILTLLPVSAFARYSERICNSPNFHCIKIHGGQTWYSLWPNDRQRDLVKRLNRMNTSLRPGMIVAVPRNINGVTAMDISPFPGHIAPRGRSTVIVSLGALAWGAYDEGGNLLRWGPASGGRGYCSDIHRGCHTPTGLFTVYEKRGPGCVSTKFPIGRGGAPMPYCMFFHGGMALHGSPEVPGFNASHGCVRLFVDDARWLNQDFIRNGSTRIIVLPS
jgi:L,D-transpeptidase ErfK/SrfK